MKNILKLRSLTEQELNTFTNSIPKIFQETRLVKFMCYDGDIVFWDISKRYGHLHGLQQYNEENNLNQSIRNHQHGGGYVDFKLIDKKIHMYFNDESGDFKFPQKKYFLEALKYTPNFITTSYDQNYEELWKKQEKIEGSFNKPDLLTRIFQLLKKIKKW